MGISVFPASSGGDISSSIINAKGDLLVGTAGDTVSRLAVGTNDYVLTAASGETTGLKWAAAAGGKVLQVVSAVYSTETVIASTTLTDTGLSVSITPSAATSKILILTSQQLRAARTSGSRASGGVRLMRDATEIFAVLGSNNDAFIFSESSAGTSIYINITGSIVYLDSPSSTSAITYKTQARATVTTSGGSVTAQSGGSSSSIIAIEIGA